MTNIESKNCSNEDYCVNLDEISEVLTNKILDNSTSDNTLPHDYVPDISNYEKGKNFRQIFNNNQGLIIIHQHRL